MAGCGQVEDSLGNHKPNSEEEVGGWEEGEGQERQRQSHNPADEEMEEEEGERRESGRERGTGTHWAALFFLENGCQAVIHLLPLLYNYYIYPLDAYIMCRVRCMHDVLGKVLHVDTL